jgi:hypothetical protein
VSRTPRHTNRSTTHGAVLGLLGAQDIGTSAIGNSEV